MSILRKEVVSEWCLQYLSDEDQAVWGRCSEESKVDFIIRGCISVTTTRRIDRLRMVGNAVVPLQAAFAFLTLRASMGDYLMGLPVGWTGYDSLETPSCHFVAPMRSVLCSLLSDDERRRAGAGRQVALLDLFGEN